MDNITKAILVEMDCQQSFEKYTEARQQGEEVFESAKMVDSNDKHIIAVLSQDNPNGGPGKSQAVVLGDPAVAIAMLLFQLKTDKQLKSHMGKAVAMCQLLLALNKINEGDIEGAEKDMDNFERESGPIFSQKPTVN